MIHMLTYTILTTIVFLCGIFFHVEYISAYYMLASFFYLYYQIDHDRYTFKEYLTYMVPFTIIAFSAVCYRHTNYTYSTVQYNDFSLVHADVFYDQQYPFEKTISNVIKCQLIYHIKNHDRIIFSS